MTLQSSGDISVSDIVTEFNNLADAANGPPYSLSTLFSDGMKAYPIADSAGTPISFNKFYGVTRQRPSATSLTSITDDAIRWETSGSYVTQGYFDLPAATGTLADTFAQYDGFTSNGSYLWAHEEGNAFGLQRGTLWRMFCSTAYDINTITSIKKFTMSAKTLSSDPDLTSYQIAFSNDGTKFYQVGGNQIIYEWAMSTAHDGSTATYTRQTAQLGSTRVAYGGIATNGNGTRLYTVANNTIVAWSMTGGNVSTLSFLTAGATGRTPNPNFLWVDNTGVGATTIAAHIGDISFTYTTSSGSTGGLTEISGAGRVTGGKFIHFYSSGTKAIIADDTMLWPGTCSTAYRLTTQTIEAGSSSSYAKNFGTYTSETFAGTTRSGAYLSKDGTKLYSAFLLNSTGKGLGYRTLTTPYDVSTTNTGVASSTTITNINDTNFEGDPWFNATGTYFTVKRNLYHLSNPWVMSSTNLTPTQMPNLLNLVGQSYTPAPWRSFVSFDGKRVMFQDTVNNPKVVYVYGMTTAWDFSTMITTPLSWYDIQHYLDYKGVTSPLVYLTNVDQSGQIITFTYRDTTAFTGTSPSQDLSVKPKLVALAFDYGFNLNNYSYVGNIAEIEVRSSFGGFLTNGAEQITMAGRNWTTWGTASSTAPWWSRFYLDHSGVGGKIYCSYPGSPRTGFQSSSANTIYDQGYVGMVVQWLLDAAALD